MDKQGMGHWSFRQKQWRHFSKTLEVSVILGGLSLCNVLFLQQWDGFWCRSQERRSCLGDSLESSVNYIKLFQR